MNEARVFSASRAGEQTLRLQLVDVVAAPL
jgi:hypothetical protein